MQTDPQHITTQVQNSGGQARWAAGGTEPTIADFLLYDVIEQARTLAGGILAAGGLKCVVVPTGHGCMWSD